MLYPLFLSTIGRLTSTFLLMGRTVNAPLPGLHLGDSLVFKSLSFSELIHVPVLSLVFFILMSRIPFSPRMFVISVVAVHADSIHALCGLLSAAGICVFWSDSSLGMVKELPNILS